MLDITPTQGFPHMYDFIGKTAARGANPLVLVVLTAVIMLYYLLFSYLGVGSSSAGPGASSGATSVGMTFIEIILWGLFVFLVLINGLQYFFKVDIRAGIKNLFTKEPEVDIAVITPPDDLTEKGDGSGDDTSASDGTVPEIMLEKQVFHIPDNVYTYKDAKAVCAAYGAKLADYSQVEDAYNKGGEWCGFGWSDNQMALYPTQKTTWDKLQNIKGHQHDCGRPGVNGGFIGNENVRFGINCYGYKPKITKLERELMEKSTPIPMTKRERRFEKKVNYFRNKLPDMLVSPFNYEQWSQV
tara:strand:+ start:800 stop:1696 length:897 start_codon:yes stop_codon:yes gene_type:complete